MRLGEGRVTLDGGAAVPLGRFCVAEVVQEVGQVEVVAGRARLVLHGPAQGLGRLFRAAQGFESHAAMVVRGAECVVACEGGVGRLQRFGRFSAGAQRAGQRAPGRRAFGLGGDGGPAMGDGQLRLARAFLGLGQVEQGADMGWFQPDRLLPGDAGGAAVPIGPERVAVGEMHLGVARPGCDGALEQLARPGGAPGAHGQHAGEQQGLRLFRFQFQNGVEPPFGFGPATRLLIGDGAEQERDEGGGRCGHGVSMAATGEASVKARN